MALHSELLVGEILKHEGEVIPINKIHFPKQVFPGIPYDSSCHPLLRLCTPTC